MLLVPLLLSRALARFAQVDSLSDAARSELRDGQRPAPVALKGFFDSRTWGLRRAGFTDCRVHAATVLRARV